jgi:hypothetical protein
MDAQPPFLSTLNVPHHSATRGDFSHQRHSGAQDERNIHPAHGFVTATLVAGLGLTGHGTVAAGNESRRRMEVDDAIARRSEENKHTW